MGGYLDGSEKSYWDLCDANAGKGLSTGQPLFNPRTSFSEGFSFYAEANWDCVRQWSRIFDFGKDAGSTNIIAVNWDKESKMGFSLCSSKKKLGNCPDWTMNWGKGETYGMHIYPGSAQCTVGYFSSWLFVIHKEGRMQIFKDGQLCGEERFAYGYDPSDVDRTKFLIGRSWFKIALNHPNENFKGTIRNIKIWDRAVSWDAVVGAAEVQTAASSYSPDAVININNGPCYAVPDRFRSSNPAYKRFVVMEIPAQNTMVSIIPSLDGRVIIELPGWSAEDWRGPCGVPLPAPLHDRGLSQEEWQKMMTQLRDTQSKACLVPIFPIYVLYLIIFVFTIGRLLVVPLLVAILLPLGWCCDVHQMFLKRWLSKWNRILEARGMYVKFQTFQKDFHEKKYVMIAFTPQEVERLKMEPRFQRGIDIAEQEPGSAGNCPIDSHRVL